MAEEARGARYVVDVERLVAQFMDLVRIDSPVGEEAAMASALAAELSALGLAATNDRSGSGGAGNLLATLPATAAGEPVLFVAHMDTVAPGRGIKPQLQDGVITSDGTTILGADNKAAVAAVLAAVRYLRASNLPHGGVEVVFTWGEERGLRGARALDVSRLRSRLCFVVDADGPPGTIVNRAPYHVAFTATFHGKAAHAGIEPEKGVNAIVAASRAIAAMPLGRLDAETTANVGRFRADGARNIIPERVEIEGETRSLDGHKIQLQAALMRRAMEEAAAGCGAQVEIDMVRNYDGFSVPEDAPPVRLASAAARALGLTPTVGSTGGGSDANILNAKGLPTIVLGMGGRDYHSTRESITVAELVGLAEWLIAIAVGGVRQ